MSKKKRTTRPEITAAKRIARDAYVADLRDGRKLRPATFPNRKAVAARNACRGKAWS